jgi:MoaA/NifB/PqqE/SkfB family radical SAM enzyme
VKIDKTNIEILEYLLICMVGEFGELSNIIKKVVCGDYELEEVKDILSEELIDVFIYIIKLAYQLDIDIEEVYKMKMKKTNSNLVNLRRVNKLDKFYELQVEIENKCFMDCKHCSSHEMRQLGERDFSVNDLIKVLKLLNTRTHVYLTGGDPILNNNILSIGKKTNQMINNINIGLFSSGIINVSDNLQPISCDYARLMKDAGIDDIYLSLYHIDKQIHDYITNMTESFKYTMETIHNLIEVGIEVKIHLVINKFNINKLDDIIRSISKLGVKEIRLLRLVQNGNATHNWNEIGISYKKQNNAIINIINNLDSYNNKITVSGFPEITPCRPFENSIKCQAGTNLLYITYEGKIYPCACTKNQSEHLIGHISELDKIRKYIKNNKKNNCNKSCLNPII